MNALLQPRLKLWLHIVEVVFILPIIILTIVRVTMGVPFSGNGRMGLAFGAKSLGFIAYQLLTEHVRVLKRWKSLKAYTIINAIEILFWVAAVYLVIASLVGRTCNGTVCALGWVIVVCAIVLVPLAVWVFAICWFDFKRYRANGNRYPEELEAAADGGRDGTVEQVTELPKYENATPTSSSNGSGHHGHAAAAAAAPARLPVAQGSPHFEARYDQYQMQQQQRTTEYHQNKGYAGRAV